MMPSPRSPILLTVDQCAEALNLGRTVIYRLIQTGELHSYKIGRSRRISVDAIQDFVARLASEQSEDQA